MLWIFHPPPPTYILAPPPPHLSSFASASLLSVAPASTPLFSRERIHCPPGCCLHPPASTARLCASLHRRPRSAAQVPPVPWIPAPRAYVYHVPHPLVPPPSRSALDLIPFPCHPLGVLPPVGTFLPLYSSAALLSATPPSSLNLRPSPCRSKGGCVILCYFPYTPLPCVASSLGFFW